jgi:UDP-N-acetylmuramate dehydrogenase
MPFFVHKIGYNEKGLNKNCKTRKKYFEKAKKYATIGEDTMDAVCRFATYADFTMEKPFDLAKHSSIGCGGFADVVFYPKTVDETARLIQKLKADAIPYYVVGNMTNVLPLDGRCEKAIVCLKNLSGIVVGEETFAYAGVLGVALLRACKGAGKSGLEFLKGIPCTLGGALYMNAGVRGAYMDGVVRNVLVLRNGEKRVLSWKECAFSYKHSVFMDTDDIILGATLRLKNADVEDVEERENAYMERRAHLPKGKSMGCVFKNPVGAVAGDLIEKSGLKGLRVGGAVVSEKHANFIINDKSASARDIVALITLIKNAVYAQYGVKLEEEIRYLT